MFSRKPERVPLGQQQRQESLDSSIASDNNDDCASSSIRTVTLASQHSSITSQHSSIITQISSSSCWRHAIHNLQSQWKIVVAGQLLSFLLACTGAAQATLAFSCSLSAPTFTIGFFYFALAFCLIPVCFQGGKHQQRERRLNDNREPSDGVLRDDDSSSSSRQRIRTTTVLQAPHSFLRVIPLQAPVWAYLIMAFLDVYANYFTVLAFKYTTITSVTLFDALAIPSSMIISKIFLTRQYTMVHIAGVLCCSIGVVVNVLQDYHDDTTITTTKNIEQQQQQQQQTSEDNPYYPHKLWGDLLAITGGILFGANNVLGEVAVRNFGGPNEYLGMLGLFATIICSIQTVLLERDDIAEFFGRGDKSETCSEAEAWLVLAGYFVSSVLSYMGGARFLQVSEATFFNLSLLTGDLWSVAFSVIAERIIPKPLFFVALVFTVSGVFVYEMAPTPVLEDRDELNHQEGAWREERGAGSGHMELAQGSDHDLHLT